MYSTYTAHMMVLLLSSRPILSPPPFTLTNPSSPTLFLPLPPSLLSYLFLPLPHPLSPSSLPQGYVEKMFKMVMAISHKEGAKINANTFELCIEVRTCVLCGV